MSEDSEAATPKLNEAALALQGGDWEAAEQAFAEAVALSPLDPRGHMGLALVAIQQGDWDRSVAHGRQGSALEGASVELHNNLGWALEQLGKVDQAIAAYKKAFETDPSRAEPIAHLFRHGQALSDGAEEPAPPLALESLQRLELYQHLAGPLQQEGCDHSWRGTWIWCMERGAPWPQVVSWLIQQGVACDCTVLTQLSQRDEYLSAAIVRGFILAPDTGIEAAVREAPDWILTRSDDELAVAPRLHPPPGQGSVLTLRTEGGTGRVQIPAQRTHAGVLYYSFVGQMALLGPESNIVLVLDPSVHIGPRRVWLLSPIAEVELVGRWTGVWEDGAPVAPDSLPGDIYLLASSVPLVIPGVDAASLQAAIDDAGFSKAVQVEPEGGLLRVDADAVGKEPASWRTLLERLARWMPEGALSSVLWREEAQVYLAHLMRQKPPRIAALQTTLPDLPSQKDLPLDASLFVLARALFEAPQSSRFLGD